jgi:hypothetical protein
MFGNSFLGKISLKAADDLTKVLSDLSLRRIMNELKASMNLQRRMIELIFGLPNEPVQLLTWLRSEEHAYALGLGVELEGENDRVEKMPDSAFARAAEIRFTGLHFSSSCRSDFSGFSKMPPNR